MNWYRKASDRGMKYRNMPFAPIAPDRAFNVTGDFSKLVRVLEDVLVGLKDWKTFSRTIDEMKKLNSAAEDVHGFISALLRLEKIGANGDKNAYQQALSEVQLAFLGNMYHPGGNGNMRALMPNENTDVMR